MQARQLLEKLIAIPSVNPMGKSSSGDQFFEAKLTQFLVRLFEANGIPFELLDVAPQRQNVIAYLAGAADWPTVLLDAHQDTVPVDEMTIAPFSPIRRGDRLYGRGACDVKGGMAAMLTALLRLRELPVEQRSPVVMACTCDEECDEMGVKQLIQAWAEASAVAGGLFSQPDHAIVAEPTELHVAVAHRGATRWKLRTHGVPAHSSEPELGVNAIYRMAEVLRCLERYAQELSQSASHPLCGAATLSVGRIEGGTSVNIVPAECTIEIDRRILPGHRGDVIGHLQEYLRERLDFEVEMLPPWMEGVPLSDQFNQELSNELVQIAESVWAGCARVGVPYGTHAARYAEAGIPSVVFGPGSVAQAHTKDEWIDVHQLEAAAEILFRFLAKTNRYSIVS